MKRMTLALILAALNLPVMPADATEPEFHATYRAYYGSMRGAEAVFSLEQEDDGEWLWQSRSEPAGMVAMFRDDVITERSRFRVEDDRLHAISYRYRHEEDGETRRFRRLAFDWNGNRVHYRDDGNEGEMDVPTGSFDRFLAQYALIRALNQDRRPEQFHIVDGDEQFAQRLEYHGTETIDVRAGDFEALRVDMKDADSERRLVIWFAPSLGHLPVKLEQREPGETTVTMELESTNRERAND